MSDRAAWLDVDLGAVAANVRWLRQQVAPAGVCAVVKADGYGHGAVAVARTALEAGADRLAVATVDEGLELRRAGVEGRVMVLSQPALREWSVAHEHDLEPAVYSAGGIDAACRAAGHTHVGTGAPWVVHLKVDTGMHRVGASPDHLVELARRIDEHPVVRLGSVWSHLAVADEPDHPFTAVQVARFDAALAALASAGIAVPEAHLANSAGGLAHPAARHDLVRCGIAVYGLAPSAALDHACARLHPAMAVRATVSHVQRLQAGEGVSYGLRWTAPVPTTVATLPLGYADGVPRRASEVGLEVLLRGRRRPIVGTVTMDQLLIACGDDEVAVGEEAVVLGSQGSDHVTAQEWAEKLGTISYEVVCNFSRRLRTHHIAHR